MSTLPSPPLPLNLCSVLSEFKRVFLAHPRHFLVLTVLFLLPLSFFSNLYFILQNSITAAQFRHHSHDTTTVSIFLPLIYNVVALFLSLLAVGSITFSTYHAFLGRPVKLITSLLSLLRSFLPLLFTYLASVLIQFLVLIVFGLILLLIIGFNQFIGFEIGKSSPFFILFCLIAGVITLLVLLYLQLNWSLAPVIVVVESSWGFEPLRRSTKLVKGMRGLLLSMILVNGICSGLLVLGCSFLSDRDSSSWKTWSFVLRTVASTAVGVTLMLQYCIAITVLYMYCKAAHGEIAGEYVRLPFDDGKVDHVVSVTPASELGMPLIA